MVRSSVTAPYSSLPSAYNCVHAQVKSCCSDIVISEQSVSLMARYFGTRVGFFFAWVQFYVLSLCFPAVFGVYIWWRQHASGPAVQEDESTAMLTDTLTPCFNIFLALWGAIFLQYWKRRSAWLAYKWGVHQADSMARNKALARRHDFDAVRNPDPFLHPMHIY
jgi:hypothetical protein